jgi:hypothetical protein
LCRAVAAMMTSPRFKVSPFAEVTLEEAGLLCNRPGQGIEIQGLQEVFGVLFVLRMQTSIDLGDVDGTAGQDVALLDQVAKKIGAGSFCR